MRSRRTPAWVSPMMANSNDGAARLGPLRTEKPTSQALSLQLGTKELGQLALHRAPNSDFPGRWRKERRGGEGRNGIECNGAPHTVVAASAVAWLYLCLKNGRGLVE